MESPLEVLSRAATMVQDSANGTLTIGKQLPTAKWKRERRTRCSTEYPAPSSPPKQLSNDYKNDLNNTDTALDMSVTSLKPRSPPPPYREPLPGSQFSTYSTRPSVITQAPKRDVKQDSIHNSNRKSLATESISMVDPVIDEHFRRSLGADYLTLFGNKKNNSTNIDNIRNNINANNNNSHNKKIFNANTNTSTTMNNSNNKTNAVTIPNIATAPAAADAAHHDDVDSADVGNDVIGMKVDDHFAKALGETWKLLKADGIVGGTSTSSTNNVTATTTNTLTTIRQQEWKRVGQCYENLTSRWKSEYN